MIYRTSIKYYMLSNNGSRGIKTKILAELCTRANLQNVVLLYYVWALSLDAFLIPIHM